MALVFLPFLRTRGQSKTILLYMLVERCSSASCTCSASGPTSTCPFNLLFTVLTPLYITLIHDLLSRRRLRWGYLLSAALARWWGGDRSSLRQGDDHLTGLMFVQLANIARHRHGGLQAPDGNPPGCRNITRLRGSNMGAAIVAVAAWFALGNPKVADPPPQWSVLVWLGVVASGWATLWNYGATRVDAGTLGIK